MKLDLCEIFKVKDKQHFWIKEGKYLNECYVEDNKLWDIGEDLTGEVQWLNLMSIDEIYYTKPKQSIELTEKTKQFLKLINKDYKYIVRDRNNRVLLYNDKPKKFGLVWSISSDTISLIDNIFDIDLSFIKWEDEKPYLISELLGDNND